MLTNLVRVLLRPTRTPTTAYEESASRPNPRWTSPARRSFRRIGGYRTIGLPKGAPISLQVVSGCSGCQHDRLGTWARPCCVVAPSHTATTTGSQGGGWWNTFFVKYGMIGWELAFARERLRARVQIASRKSQGRVECR